MSPDLGLDLDVWGPFSLSAIPGTLVPLWIASLSGYSARGLIFSMKHLQRKHECTSPHERSQLPTLLVAGKFFWCGDKKLLKGFQFLRDGRRRVPRCPGKGAVQNREVGPTSRGGLSSPRPPGAWQRGKTLVLGPLPAKVWACDPTSPCLSVP